MKNLLKYTAWGCTAVAAILMILGSIAAVFCAGKLFNHFWANYFYPSVSFIGMAILLHLYSKSCCDEKD